MILYLVTDSLYSKNLTNMQNNREKANMIKHNAKLYLLFYGIGKIAFPIP